MKQFLGFTPDQASKMLQQKGLRANSREGAEYLAGMHKRAQDMLDTKGSYQYGGQVGGFDDKSRKLFDAAVKRTASTEPKSPEVQRYIDNVIDTRGRPTMVYPTTADPLMGYANGGDVDDLMRDNQVKRKILAERVKANVDFQGDRQTYELIEKLPFLGRIAEDHYLKLLANSVDAKIGRQADMPFSTRLMFAGKDAKADNELYKELLSYADQEMPQGTQEPTGETPLYQKRMQEDVDRKNKMLMMREGFASRLADDIKRKEEEAQRLYERSQEQIDRDRMREMQEFNDRRRERFLERQGKPEFQEGGDVKNPNVVNPFPTTGATGTAPRDKARDNLNKAQADLASTQQELSNLQQQLAKLPTDASQDQKRQEIVDSITNLGIKITQNEAAVASASSAFQSVGIPTSAEAVGTTVSAPDDIVTRQQVNLMPTDDVSIKDQLLKTGTGKLDDRTDKTETKAVTDTADAPTQPATVTKTATEVAQDVRDEALTKTTGTLSPDAEAQAQIIKTEDLNIRDIEASPDTDNVQVVSPAK